VYGKLDFSGNGIDYVWKIPFGSCGTETRTIMTNTELHSNWLQAINPEFQSGMNDLENLLIEYSCEFNNETVMFENINIVSDRSSQTTEEVFSVNFDNEADVEENIKHTIQQFSFVEEITNSDFYSNIQKQHLLVDVGISNLDVGTETTGQRNQVLTIDRCWLSDSSERIVSELDLLVVENGCPVADYSDYSDYEFVEILENGVSQNVKFSIVNVLSEFKFVHCEVDVCDANSRSCSPVC